MDNLSKKRHEFPSSVIQSTKMRAAFVCSNPNCKLMTIGPSEADDEKVLYNGKIAHILPAAEGGPRDVIGTTPGQRTHQDNALFLCGSCADLIDKNNGIDYSIDLLKKWKTDHMQWVGGNLNKQLTNNSGLIVNGNDGLIVGVQNIYYGNIEINPEDIHDKDIFLKLEKVADEEKLIRIFRSLKDYHRIFDSQQDILDAVLEFLKRTKHTFLAKELSDTASQFITELEDLMGVLLEFDSWPYHQGGSDHKSELMPKIRHWTGIQPTAEEKLLYNKLSAKLVALDKTVIHAYETFRMAVKKRLYV